MHFKKTKKFLKEKALFFSVVAVIIGAFYGGYYIGNLQSFKIQNQNATSTFSVSREDASLLDADFSLFWDAVKITKEKYVNISEVKDKDFVYGAIKGAVSALDDPYSAFLEPSDAKKFDEDIKGSFGGIGAEIGIRNNELIVISPLKGNPAEKVGLKAGDKILKVDDKSTAGIPVEEAVKLIRGKAGTTVRLFIFRDGWKEAKEFKITRQIIIVPTLDWQMIKAGEDEEREDIFYVQLHNFNANASSLFREASLAALFKGARGVVLDLRNDAGGYLDVAIDIAGWFIDRGDIIVREKFRDAKTEKLVSRGNSAFRNIPVVVLVNNGSASASEIVAGALRDTLGAKLVGVKTFGKGSVQELDYLKDGSTLKISTAEWLTPKGAVINKKGLEPDVVIKEPEEKKNGSKKEPAKDIQLEKALEVLRPQLSKEKPLQTILLGF